MSSHHIVRDRQEPALLIHRMEEFPLPILHELLEWLPVVVCNEASIRPYISQGHKLDVALVGFQKVEFWNEILQEQAPVAVIGSGDDFLKSGLEILVDRGHSAVNVITDELSLKSISGQCLEWIDRLEIILFTEKKRHILHNHLEFTKWLPANSSLILNPLVTGSQFTTEGFDVDVEHLDVQEELIVKKTREGAITVRCSHGPFLVSESI